MTKISQEITELKEIILNQEGVLHPDTIQEICASLDNISADYEELQKERDSLREDPSEIEELKEELHLQKTFSLPGESLLDEMKMEVMKNIFANASLDDLNVMNDRLKAFKKHYKEVI